MLAYWGAGQVPRESMDGQSDSGSNIQKSRGTKAERNFTLSKRRYRRSYAPVFHFSKHRARWELRFTIEISAQGSGVTR